MSLPLGTTEARYATIVAALLGSDDVSFGSPDGTPSKPGFGSSALRINNKIFAMLSPQGGFALKLPRGRVDKVIASGHGERFDPGHGWLMKEWVVIAPTAEADWLTLAREAMEFVGAATRTRK